MTAAKKPAAPAKPSKAMQRLERLALPPWQHDPVKDIIRALEARIAELEAERDRWRRRYPNDVSEAAYKMLARKEE